MSDKNATTAARIADQLAACGVRLIASLPDNWVMDLIKTIDGDERFVHVPADFPRGDPFNVGQIYALFAEAIRTGQNRLPTFDTAVDLHRFIDIIKQASETGRELPVA